MVGRWKNEKKKVIMLLVNSIQAAGRKGCTLLLSPSQLRSRSHKRMEPSPLLPMSAVVRI